MEEMKIILDDADNIVGRNIRRLRLAGNLKQTDLTARLQIYQVAITRESLVKIEAWDAPFVKTTMEVTAND